MVLLTIRTNDHAANFNYSCHLHDDIIKVTNDVAFIEDGLQKCRSWISDLSEFARSAVPETSTMNSRSIMSDVCDQLSASLELLLAREHIETSDITRFHESLQGVTRISCLDYSETPVNPSLRRHIGSPLIAIGSTACTATLWWAGKPLLYIPPGKVALGDYLGRNDKCKIVVRIQPVSCATAPVRTPFIDEQTHKNMLSFYYKRQEELKRLEDDDNDDSYLESVWTDPKELKRSLNGFGGEVKVRFN